MDEPKAKTPKELREAVYALFDEVVKAGMAPPDVFGASAAVHAAIAVWYEQECQESMRERARTGGAPYYYGAKRGIRGH